MDKVISTKELTKRFGSQTGVERMNLTVRRGEIYGLLGKNGSGKTTAIRMLMGLCKPTSGSLLLFDSNPAGKAKQIYRRIGSLIETPGFYPNLSGSENLGLLAHLRGTQKKHAAAEALQTMGLEKEGKKPYYKYSLGMKQRLGIAAAVMHEPELLILDEPINGLDPMGIHEIRRYLERLCREKNTTILISSHILSEIEQLAHTIGIMDEGKLLEEVSMEELHKRNRRYVEFVVSDERTACLLLEEQLLIKDYSVHENKTLRLYTNMEQRGIINQCFVENGIQVTDVRISEEKLEEYFSKRIGGNAFDSHSAL